MGLTPKSEGYGFPWYLITGRGPLCRNSTHLACLPRTRLWILIAATSLRERARRCEVRRVKRPKTRWTFDIWTPTSFIIKFSLPDRKCIDPNKLQNEWLVDAPLLSLYWGRVPNSHSFWKEIPWYQSLQANKKRGLNFSGGNKLGTILGESSQLGYVAKVPRLLSPLRIGLV